MWVTYCPLNSYRLLLGDKTSTMETAVSQISSSVNGKLDGGWSPQVWGGGGGIVGYGAEEGDWIMRQLFSCTAFPAANTEHKPHFSLFHRTRSTCGI